MAYPISDVTRRVVYSGSAGTGPYSFSFEILANTDIAVYKNTTLLTLTTDYTVTINTNGTGSVTLVSAATGSDNITLVGNRSIERATDFVTGGDLFANSLNDEFDSLVIFAQQVKEEAGRGLKAPITDPTDVNMTLPVKASRKGKVLAFDSTTGDPVNGPALDSLVTVIEQSDNINTVADNITDVNTVADDISDVSTVAGIAGNVSTVAGISSNVTTVAGISSNVTTVAGISANVTTVAGISAAVTTNANNIVAIQNASTNATNASNSASSASTSATNAASSATSAASAQTAAEAARDATLAAYDSFDDRYLGAKSSNPSVDNDGNALVAGALYYNTTTPEMRLYTGSAWVAAYVSGAGYLASANNLSDLTSASTARTNLGLGTLATQSSSAVNITGGSISGITDLAVADGGTGASTASGALSNLGGLAKAGDTLTGALNEAAFVTLASASTVNIGAAASNNISITGTTTITAFDTIAAGAVRRLVFAGALTLTHNATSLILPSGASITTAAGDVAQLVSLGSGNWRCINYMKANGQAVVAAAGGVTSFIGQTGAVDPTVTGAIGSIVGACYIVTTPSTGVNTSLSTKYSTGLTVAGSSLAYDVSFVGSGGTNGNITAGIGSYLVKRATSGTSSMTFPAQNAAIGASFYPSIPVAFYTFSGAFNATVNYSTLSGSWRALSTFAVTMSYYSCDSAGIWPVVAWQRYA
jgi:hypothetical protein